MPPSLPNHLGMSIHRLGYSLSDSRDQLSFHLRVTNFVPDILHTIMKPRKVRPIHKITVGSAAYVQILYLEASPNAFFIGPFTQLITQDSFVIRFFSIGSLMFVTQ